MKICFIPIDNRPVCYNLAADICSIDDDIELCIPPRKFLGDLTKNADIVAILEWLKKQDFETIILSLDTLAYGGLIPSRRSKDSLEEIKLRLENLKTIIKNKKVYAFSSIMRISNNNYNEEEKDYWKNYGKKIFEYSFNGGKGGEDIPNDILEDYLEGRRRNFTINKLYLEWQKEGIFDTLIFSKDDCAIKGFNVDEAKELESLGGMTKTGADEIPLTLLARAIRKNIKVYIDFIEPDYKNCVSNYEDISIEQSVGGQLELGGFTRVLDRNEADIILIINNFVEKQGELVMKWETGMKYQGGLNLPQKPYAIADVRFANGADNDFIQDFWGQFEYNSNFYGYSAWNTSANTLGSLLAGIKVKYSAKKYNDNAFRKLQMIRFLDDWAYQANVRGNDINMMKSYENKLKEIFSYDSNISYKFPWNRTFEIEVII